jgi:hypothetical protein
MSSSRASGLVDNGHIGSLDLCPPELLQSSQILKLKLLLKMLSQQVQLGLLHRYGCLLLWMK